VITHYGLRGFKSFRRESDFRLAPLTLIYGGNSSGKSTIVQSMMLLKQTLEAPGLNSAPLIFGSKKYVDLGTFYNAVSDHASSNSIHISLSASRLEPVPRRYSPKFKAAISDLLLDITVGCDLVGTPVLTELRLSDKNGCVVRFGPASAPFSREELRMYLQRNRFSQVRGIGASGVLAFDLIDIDEQHPFVRLIFDEYAAQIPAIHEALISTQHSPYLYEILALGDGDEEAASTREAQRGSSQAAMRARADELAHYKYEQFISDLRAYNQSRFLAVERFLPSGTLARKGTKVRGLALDHRATIEFRNGADFPVFDFGSILLTVANAVASELSAMTYIGPLRDYPERNYIYSGIPDESVGSRGENFPALFFAEERRRNELNELGKLIGLEYTIDIFQSKEPELNSVYALRLTDSTTGANVGLSDVGFGVSQVLPILMQCTARSNATLVIEQPEIHLNPRLQASLGQVFARAIEGSQRQFIVETHSEHLLLRIQRLIREGKLDPQNVAVLYVSKHEEGSSVLEIPLATNGDRLVDWPDGFFDDTYRELFDEAPLR
jgi:hypothetical protein